MSPPIARASCLTDDSPSPAPPKREAMLTLACENGRNRRLISSSVRPMPLSDTAKATPTLPFGAAQRRRRQRDAALFGELHRIVDQVFQRRAQPDGIADHEAPEAFPKYRPTIAGLSPPPGRPANRRRCAPAPADRTDPAASRRPAPRPFAASTNNVARLARCSAPALMVSTQRRSRSSRSDVASRLLIARMPVSGVRTSCANAASAASTMPGATAQRRAWRRALAAACGGSFGSALLRRPPFRRPSRCAVSAVLTP